MIESETTERKRSLDVKENSELDSIKPNKRILVKEETKIEDNIKILHHDDDDHVDINKENNEFISFSTPKSPQSNNEEITVSMPPNFTHNRTQFVSISLRCLMLTKEAGVIIGKSGSNIAEVRNQTNCKVTITDNSNGAVERVVTCNGILNNAFFMMTISLLNDAVALKDARSKMPLRSQRHFAVVKDERKEVQIRLLISHKSMGVIIGKQGCKIQEIQTLSKTRMHASEEILPNSTERILYIAGTPQEIQDAILEIAKALSAYPERGPTVVHYQPLPPSIPIAYTQPTYGSYYSGSYYGTYPNTFSTNYYGYGTNGYETHPYLYNQSNQKPAIHGQKFYQDPFIQQVLSAPPDTSGPKQSQQVVIPNDLIGRIIGKAGAKINEIRQISKATIKIADQPDESNQRYVTIVGTSDSVNVALHMLYRRLEEEGSKPT